MKQIKLRIEVMAEDAVLIEKIQARLREQLDGMGTESLGEPIADDLGGSKPGPRVFWQTAEVKQGNAGGQEAPPAKRLRVAK